MSDVCRQIGGHWTLASSCIDGPSIDCEIEHEAGESCEISVDCADGQRLTGTVSESSLQFSDDEVSCMGSEAVCVSGRCAEAEDNGQVGSGSSGSPDMFGGRSGAGAGGGS